ncbi:PAS domain S-box protein [Parapedobacter koreensis]|uniref:histidine kinase n=1 Tax=Parapedobacter koreensis TaxID=332977 RepID=A0A1H7S5B8_9SPHI|nr:PAS domain S-box protein [Parapedobacter koreensis]SEL66924.1 PAS domain S-box-containing protein [Parapedobacter koreensis]
MISEKHYSAMFEALPTPCLILLPNAPVFTIINASNTYLALSGTIEREKIVGKGFFDVFPRNPYVNQHQWQATFDQVLHEKKTDKVITQKYPFPLPGLSNGVDIKYFDVLNTPVLDEQGAIMFIIRSMTDVTETIRHERLLEQTQQMARSGNWEVSMVHRTVTWSQRLKTILQVDSAFQPDFESALSFFDTISRKSMLRAFQKANRHGTSFRLTLPVITAKGRERWLSTVGKADMVDGVCVRIYGISKDITDKRNTENALVSSDRNFQNLIQTIDGIVWEASVEPYELTFISKKVERMLGYTAKEWFSEPDFWMKHIHESDRERATKYHRQQTKKLANHTFDYRAIKKNGDTVWIKNVVSVISKSGKPRWLRGIMVDITETKRLADLDHLEKNILELTTHRNTPVKLILSEYLLGIEALFPGLYCSIHRVHDGRLFNWAAPSLPQAYSAAIHNRQIGDNTGSCGTAAYLKIPIIVSDIATDPKWYGISQAPLSHGLKACWSYPIIDSEGSVMAVLGLYYKQIKAPNAEELAIVERTATLLKMILENRRNADLAQEVSAMIDQAQELARFGNWQWDAETNRVRWSSVLRDIYGFANTDYHPTFQGYLAALHNDDKARSIEILKQVRKTGNDSVFEERIVRPDGETRYLKTWVRCMFDEEGIPIKMIGACLDITEMKHNELKLKQMHRQLEKHLREVEESEAKYSNLFHLSPQPMWVYDLETYRFLDVNVAAIKHYGYTREEFFSMTIKDIKPSQKRLKLGGSYEFSKEHDELFNQDVYIHRKKNGEIIHVEVQSVIINFHGRTAALILAQDITEKLNHIEAIETQNRKLQEIAWMQSHVVRAPLARIMGLVDLIQNFPESGVENGELLDSINGSAIELDDILKAITNKAEQINFT